VRKQNRKKRVSKEALAISVSLKNKTEIMNPLPDALVPRWNVPGAGVFQGNALPTSWDESGPHRPRRTVVPPRSQRQLRWMYNAHTRLQSRWHRGEAQCSPVMYRAMIRHLTSAAPSLPVAISWLVSTFLVLVPTGSSDAEIALM
jgi:hypothetical protein